MNKIKVLIVEDKLLIAEDIAKRLKSHQMEVTAICPSGEEAVKLVALMQPDLILMDIELDGVMDGISTAQSVNQHHDIPIVYLSDYADPKTVDRAKKTTPANYLTKPFNEADLVRAIDLAFSNANSLRSAKKPAGADYILLRTASQVYAKILPSDILYLKADRAYCHVFTEKNEYVLSKSMNHVYDLLAMSGLIRVHRSYIVNVNKVTSLDGNVINLGKHRVQMSPDFRNDLVTHFKVVK